MDLRLLKLDDALIEEHCYLEQGDGCFYFGDYEPSRGNRGESFLHRPINSMVLNFKKPKNASEIEQAYKTREIQTIADHLVEVILAWQQKTGKTFTLIPIPSSRLPSDKDYDDRFERLGKCLGTRVDYRFLIRSISPMTPHHSLGNSRPTPQQLKQSLQVVKNEEQSKLGDILVLFDDVLTNGCHFKACQQLLKEHFHRDVVGIFIGRTKRDAVL